MWEAAFLPHPNPLQRGEGAGDHQETRWKTTTEQLWTWGGRGSTWTRRHGRRRGSGRWLAGRRAAEEVHRLGLGFVVVDPDGEHKALCELGGVVRVARDAQSQVAFDGLGGTWIDEVIELIADGSGAVLDLAEMDEDEQRTAYAYFAQRWFKAQQRQPQSVFLFLEEAHIFAPQKDRKRAADSLRVSKAIARRGRKFGINWVAGSQRPGDLEKDFIAQANVKWFGRAEIEHDYRAIAPYLPRSVGLQTLRNLGTGEFYLSVSGELNRVKIRARRTTDLGRTPPIVARQRSFFSVMNVTPDNS